MLIVLLALAVSAYAGWYERLYGSNNVRFPTPGSGTTAPTNGAFPNFNYQVGIRISVGNGDALCGGAIIAPNFVITAAHCVMNPNGTPRSARSIRIATSYNANNFGAYSSYGFWVHANYGAANNFRLNDIAIIGVFPNFTYSSSLAEIRMACSNCINNVGGVQYTGVGSGVIYYATGFGQTISGDPNSGVVNLLYAQLTDYGMANCAAATGTSVADWGTVSGTSGAGYICAFQGNPTLASNNQDTCQGDSGGALAIWNAGQSRFELVGITSSGTGTGCGLAGQLGFYTSIPYNQAGFIQQVLTGNYGPPLFAAALAPSMFLTLVLALMTLF